MSILAGIAEPNLASVLFHEKMGFKKIGTYHSVGFKLGAYHDVSWYELQIGNPNKPFQAKNPNSVINSDLFVDITKRASLIVDLTKL